MFTKKCKIKMQPRSKLSPLFNSMRIFWNDCDQNDEKKTLHHTRILGQGRHGHRKLCGMVDKKLFRVKRVVLVCWFNCARWRPEAAANEVGGGIVNRSRIWSLGSHLSFQNRVGYRAASVPSGAGLRCRGRKSRGRWTVGLAECKRRLRRWSEVNKNTAGKKCDYEVEILRWKIWQDRSGRVGHNTKKTGGLHCEEKETSRPKSACGMVVDSTEKGIKNIKKLGENNKR